MAVSGSFEVPVGSLDEGAHRGRARGFPGGFNRQLLRTIWKNRFYYFLVAPGVVYFLVFHYLPMAGLIIAFKDVTPFSGLEGVLHNPLVGLKHFQTFFRSIFFQNTVSNTLIISGLKLIVGFPAPIILALLINEVRNTYLKRTVQTISYLPHFLSMVVVAGLVMNLLTTEGGLVNQIIVRFGGQSHMWLGDPKYFRGILVLVSLWQEVGWGTILYLAAMANVDPDLYEAAMLDGANRFQQAMYVTLPSIAYVIVILLIFRIGSLLNAGFEQILLLYSPSVYSEADIIDTYVYRAGLVGMQYSYATAVGMFKSVLAMILLLAANKLAHRLGHTGIW